MTAPSPDERGTCELDGCFGTVAANGRCLAHLDEHSLDEALTTLHAGGSLDARGVVLSRELLNRIIETAPKEGDRPTLRNAKFDDATFQGDAHFDNAVFEGDAYFRGVTFQGEARFDEAAFEGSALFHRATFMRDARFTGPFSGTAGFGSTKFRMDALFGGHTVFKSGAHFNEASFRARARFHGAEFQGLGDFQQAKFGGLPAFGKAQFNRDADFRRTTFRRAGLGPMIVTGTLKLDETICDDMFALQVSASAMTCIRSQFRGQTTLEVRWAETSSTTPASKAGRPLPPGRN